VVGVLFFNRKNKDYNYFKIFLAVFLAIVCSIVVYFLFSKLGYVVLFLKKIFKILAPVIIGVVFAYLFNPIITRIEDYLNKYDKIKKKNKLGRVLGIIITYVLFVAVIVIFIRFFIPSLLDSLNMMVKNIPKYLENVFTFIKDICEKNNINPKFIDSYRSSINETIKNSVVPNMDIIINNLATGITSVVKWIINIVVSIIISVYLIYDKEFFSNGIDKVLKTYCSPRVYREIINVAKYIYKVLGGFMVARLIDSLIIGVLTFVVLIIFKIPYAFLISLLVGITNVIPFFGPFIGAIPSIVLLLMINPTKALEFGIIILIIQQFDGNVLGPKLIGDKIGIKSFWVLFAILLFGGLFGFWGMIFAVPLFACLSEFIKYRVKKRQEYNQEQEELVTKKR
jgi:predicted PurR-regulated permease PerM